MFVAKCGGIKLNEDIFKEINGVITLSTESEVHDPVTSCGQLWDSNIFSVGKVEDRYIISMATRHEEIPLGSLIKANCSNSSLDRSSSLAYDCNDSFKAMSWAS